jgi:hypothetical protein
MPELYYRLLSESTGIRFAEVAHPPGDAGSILTLVPKLHPDSWTGMDIILIGAGRGSRLMLLTRKEPKNNEHLVTRISRAIPPEDALTGVLRMIAEGPAQFLESYDQHRSMVSLVC